MATNAQLLVALRSQSSSSYMIQFFVILAVALGIASVLAVSVVQKAREIGILRATGTGTGQVMRVFLIQGGMLGIGGLARRDGARQRARAPLRSLAQNPDGSPDLPRGARRPPSTCERRSPPSWSGSSPRCCPPAARRGWTRPTPSAMAEPLLRLDGVRKAYGGAVSRTCCTAST
jgi:hypothetical protein